MYLNDDEKKKLELYDKLFAAMNIEELQTLAEREEIVARLKGISMPRGPYAIISSELSMIQMKMNQHESDMLGMKADISCLLKTINETLYKMPPQPSDWSWTNLKNKYAVY